MPSLAPSTLVNQLFLSLKWWCIRGCIRGQPWLQCMLPSILHVPAHKWAIECAKDEAKES